MLLALEKAVSLEGLSVIHSTTHVLALPVAIAIAWWYAPKYEYSRKDAMSYSLVMMMLIVLFSYGWRWTLDWVGIGGALNSYRTFLFVPLGAWALRKRWNIPVLDGLDLITPNIFFVRAFVLIGCNLIGCGLAVPCDWGVYSPFLGCRVFPIDLLDMLANFAVACFSLVYAKKLNYNGNGRIFALSMCLLGIARWLIQFGSQEVWWIRGFNDEAVYSIVSIIMAIVIFNKNRKTNLQNGGKQDE